MSLDDPCAGATPAASAAQCARTGVTQAQYGSIIQCPSDTCSSLGGGNPALKPETADTVTLGMVLTPRQIRNFSFSVDYYHIKVKDYISSFDPSLIASQCISTGDPFYCGLFHRDPRSGDRQQCGGWLSDRHHAQHGLSQDRRHRLQRRLHPRSGPLWPVECQCDGHLAAQQESQPLPGLGSYDCKGYYGYSCGQPNPSWRHVARFTWTAPQDRGSVSLSWRHYAGTTLSSLSSNEALSANGTSIINAKIPAYDYIDLSATLKVTKAVNLRAGVNNLFDRDPPAIAAGILSAFGNGNTYPGFTIRWAARCSLARR
jgi:outer membrane receptor protein involved in Fe transport